ncbi:fimbria/pilus periplasmic chaperone [Escherichia coli]|nr:fimbria/pilus periplasmic chaperone [Escherichia coli]
MATVLLLLLFACHSTVANAAVALGATRVIYPANQKQVLLPVTNNDPASVYLIQSWIENAGDQKDTQFVITPPLFSMSVPFGAIVTHGENKNGSIVAENGQVYLTGLPQSGKLQVSWGKDKNSNCIVEYKLPEVSPGTLLNQQTAICR